MKLSTISFYFIAYLEFLANSTLRYQAHNSVTAHILHEIIYTFLTTQDMDIKRLEIAECILFNFQIMYHTNNLKLSSEIIFSRVPYCLHFELIFLYVSYKYS